MIRRDKASMQLALAWARWGRPWKGDEVLDSLWGAIEALRLGDDAANRVSAHVTVAGRYHHAHERLLRARLALYLRAVLRADAGDFGHYERVVSCTKHGRIGRTFFPDIRMSCNQCSSEWRERDRWSKASGDAYEWGGRVFAMPLALWALAPAVATRPPGLNRRREE